jgi:hypothetical protein
VMEKQEPVHISIKRQRNHAAERTMAPADVLRVLFGCSIARRFSGASVC